VPDPSERRGWRETETHDEDTAPTQSFDLTKASRIEIRDSTGKIVLYVILGIVGGAATITLTVIVAIIAAGGCPYLYVDHGRGLELAGVPFAGALYRSVQRDDLMPLGSVGAGRLPL